VEELHNGLALIHLVQEVEVLERWGFFYFIDKHSGNADLLEKRVNFPRNIAENGSQPRFQLNLAHTVHT
jgi:hypothetical protein